ncbi:AB hydrolase superfamily protein [Rutstroemia sp. NJR-2017a BVV2]|nr:AB hydrolase superfamily protein [Rutstroemia sp. NJR-2017a BVV2]
MDGMGSITPHSTPTSPPYPLHPSILPHLDPTYRNFYNSHLINSQVVHHQPLPVSRSSSILLPGASDPLSVGEVVDLQIPAKGDDEDGNETPIPIRVFIPAGPTPTGGWPLCMYFHGGGWVLGGIDTENTVCSNLCKRGEVVVVTVDYRLAPENPYPAALIDCQTTLLHILTHPALLPINSSLLALAGSSAGGNIAAVLSHRLTSPELFSDFKSRYLTVPKLQLLIVPVMDNTAVPLLDSGHSLPSQSLSASSSSSSISSSSSSSSNSNPRQPSTNSYPSWTQNQHTPALPAAKMLWFRNHYLPSPSTWSDPGASPLLHESGWEKLPRTLVVVGGLDVLRDEGVRYAEKVGMGKGKGKCRLVEWEGMPHPFLAMDGVLKQGADTITYMVEELRDVFWKDRESK